MQAASKQQQVASADNNPINPITLQLALANTQRRASDRASADTLTSEQQDAASADRTPINPINLELGADATQRRASGGLKDNVQDTQPQPSLPHDQQQQGGLQSKQVASQDTASAGNALTAGQAALVGKSGNDAAGAQTEKVPIQEGQGARLPADQGDTDLSEASSERLADQWHDKPVWRGFADAKEKALVQNRPLVPPDQQEQGQQETGSAQIDTGMPLVQDTNQQQQQQQEQPMQDQPEADSGRPLVQDTEHQKVLPGQAQEDLSRPHVQETQQHAEEQQADLSRMQVQQASQQQQQLRVQPADVQQDAAVISSGTNAEGASELHDSQGMAEQQQQQQQRRHVLAATHSGPPSAGMSGEQQVGARDAAEWVAEVTRATQTAPALEEGSRFSLWHGRSPPSDQVTN